MESQENKYYPAFGPYPCAISLEKIAKEGTHFTKIARMVNRYYDGFDKLDNRLRVTITIDSHGKKRNDVDLAFLKRKEFGFRYLILELYKDFCIKQAEISDITDNERSHLINVFKTHYKHTLRTEKSVQKWQAEQRRLQKRKEKKLSEKIQETIDKIPHVPEMGV
jgi:hypothetical protein